MNKKLTDWGIQLDAGKVLPLLLAIIAVFFTWLFVQQLEFSPALQPIIFGLVSAGLLLRQRAVIYMGVAAAMFFPLTNHNRVHSFPMLILDDVWYALITILFVTFGIRFIDVANMYRHQDKQERLADSGEVNTARNIELKLRPLVSGWLWLPLALMSATVVLWLIPWDLASDERIRIRPSGMRAISVLWLLGLIWLVVDGVLSLVSRWRQSTAQASVYTRSAFCRELRWELAPIERRRAKKIRKRSRDLENQVT
ncbi:MAG: hypothetical protein ACR2NP_21370 [Pirellulaceae bacterium]